MIQKIGLLILLFALVGWHVQEKLGLFTYWEKGDSSKVLVSEGFIEYEGDEIVKKEIEKSEVIITVLEETESSYVVQWDYLNTTYERLNVEVEEDEFDQRIEEMFGKVVMQYEIDESGNYKGLKNTEELFEMMKDSLDVLFKEAFTGSKKEAKFMRKMMKELYASDMMKEELERDFVNYHYYHGTQFAIDTTVYYDDEIENKLKGENFPAKGMFKTMLDGEEESFTISDSREINEEKMKEGMIAALELMEDDDKKQAFKDSLMSNQLKIVDRMDYTYYYKTGWLKKYEKVRELSSGKKRRETFIRIEEQ